MRFVVMAALHFDFQMASYLSNESVMTKKYFNEDSTSTEYLVNLIKKLKMLHHSEFKLQNSNNPDSRQQIQEIRQ